MTVVNRIFKSMVLLIHRNLTTKSSSQPYLNYTVVKAKNDVTAGTMVLFHGCDDSAYRWKRMCRRELEFEHLDCIFPHAPVIKYTFYGNKPTAAWFNRLNYLFNGPEDVESVEAGIVRAHALFDKIIADGTSSEKLIVAGFSQGGALALMSALTYPSKLAGIIGIACYVMRRDTMASRITANSNTQVQLIYGDADKVLPIQYGEKTFSFLKKLGMDVKMYVSPGAGHELPAEAFGLFRQSIEKWVPPPLVK